MKTIKNLTFAALALTLLLQTSHAIADNSAPIRFTFEKSFAGVGPVLYLFHHAAKEYSYTRPTLLAPAVPPPVRGELTIGSIKVYGNKLEISITNPSPTGTHVIQQTTTAVPTQWLDVDNPDFSSGPGGAIVATFRKPTNSLAFYRVEVRTFQGE